MKRDEKHLKKSSELIENIDFYIENGFMVFTSHYLKQRGYCCGSGCRHCPYEKKKSLVLEEKGF